MNEDTNIPIDGTTIANTTASNGCIAANKEASFIEAYDIDFIWCESWPGAVDTFEKVRVENVIGKSVLRDILRRRG